MASASQESEETTRNTEISVAFKGLVTSLRGMVENVAPLSPNCCIYTVPKSLREVNNEAYTPKKVSIGPLHHGDEDLKPFEEHKWRYLKDFLGHSQKPIEYLFEFIKERETLIRECYAETISIDSDEFVAIIIVDAAFIVELLLKKRCPSLRTSGDRIFGNPLMINEICLDFLMLENQLPFFVLDAFFQLVKRPQDGSTPTFIKLACDFVKNIVGENGKIPEDIDSSRFKHFTDLARSFFIPREHSQQHQLDKKLLKTHSAKGLHDAGIIPEDIESDPEDIESDLARSFSIPREHSQKHQLDKKLLKTHTAKGLHDAGIKFKRSSNRDLLDIKFTRAVLEIPQLRIYNSTECWLRNLIAFEQCHYADCYMTQYVWFLDALIDSSNDVELLVQSGVIENWLGDNENVSNLINKLTKETLLASSGSKFLDLYKKLNDYCKVRRHKWKAALRRDYFNTPWRVISVVAAVILLVLTLLQTVCSIMTIGK